MLRNQYKEFSLDILHVQLVLKQTNVVRIYKYSVYVDII